MVLKAILFALLSIVNGEWILNQDDQKFPTQSNIHDVHEVYTQDVAVQDTI